MESLSSVIIDPNLIGIRRLQPRPDLHRNTTQRDKYSKDFRII